MPAPDPQFGQQPYDRGELSSYTPELRDKVAYFLANNMPGLGDDRQGVRRAKMLTSALEYTTPLGGATMLMDDIPDAYHYSMNALGQGEYKQAMMGLPLTLGMAMIPGSAKGAKAIREAAKGARVGVGLPRGIRTYQGSPHNFAAERLVRHPDGREEFIVGQPDVLPDVPPGAEVVQDYPLGRVRLDKIGTGEGAQAYGHGAYLAEGEGVAKTYSEQLARTKFKSLTEAETNSILPQMDALHNEAKNKGPEAAQKLLDWHITNLSQIAKYEPTEQTLLALKSLKKLRENGEFVPELSKHMYEVEINADPEQFLDWDKPLSEQPESVRKAIEEHGLSPQNADLGQFGGVPVTSVPRWADTPEAAAKLKQAGIPGIKYLDQGSRGAVPPIRQQTFSDGSSGWIVRDANGSDITFTTKEKAEAHAKEQGLKDARSRNYVVFDDKLLDIKRKYGISGLIAAMGLAGAAGYSDDAQAQTPQAQGGGGW